MEMPRWLLPFTNGVDMRAIDYVVRLAESAGVTLIPVSLVSAPPKRGARLEHIQQSKDFLEAVRFKAERLGVPVERYEVFTADVLRSIAVLVCEMRCDGIVLVSRGQRTRLMQDEEVKRLLIDSPTALVLIRLPAHSRSILKLHQGDNFFSWLPSHWGKQHSASRAECVPSEEEPLWVRTEQHHLV
ncbi:MAG: universal stress protein [Chloroflexi bacterium]|nr:universal stress protein [Chloroflexota bacterium]